MRISILTILLSISIQNTCLPLNGWIQKNYGTGNLVSINFINGSTGFMFRSNKYLFKTTNSGQTWDSSLINAQGISVRQGIFINENTGGLIPYPSITTNGGASWNQSIPPHIGFTIDVQKIYLLNGTTGFLSAIDVDLDMSVDAVIYKTTDSGMNWILVDGGGGANNYADIIFINDNTGFQCRFSVLKTTNGGASWGLLSETFRQHTAFAKVFGDTMYMSSENGYVSKSINLGTNWTEYQTGVDDRLRDIYFINNQTGYAVGDTGAVVRTTNGGINWTVQNPGTTQQLNEVYFLNSDTGFIAGDSGLLLVTYNGGVTSLTQNYQNIPEKYYLYQNYPNPFNPETEIKFDIPHNSTVKLSIFDINGKEVNILVNQRLSRGSYRYVFDGSAKPSGVYFYRLETEDFEVTRRMVLLK